MRTPRIRSHHARRPLLAALALTALLAVPTGVTAEPAAAKRAPVLMGLGDDHVQMFSSPLWRQLHVGITRYIVPYDVMAHSREALEAAQWITTATSNHQQILVAFYHSTQVPLTMPSASLYRNDVAKFIRRFPQVREYQAWNESDRGFVPGYFASPSPMQSAVYYRELRSLAHHDTILGLDILDSYKIGPTLNYVAEFKRDIRRLHVPMPTLWGLHNYSDTNRYESTRTRAILAAVPGNLWLTETGGVVQYGTDFTNYHGAGLRRAAHALEYMFKLANVSPRLRRLYIYNWYGAGPSARFDAGIMDRYGHPRQGYVVVCNRLLDDSRLCQVRVNND
jgi:hypothetical protein